MGSVVGLVLLSILADQLGRKVIIVTTLFLSVLGATRIYTYICSVDLGDLLQRDSSAIHRHYPYGIRRILTDHGELFSLERDQLR